MEETGVLVAAPVHQVAVLVLLVGVPAIRAVRTEALEAVVRQEAAQNLLVAAQNQVEAQKVVVAAWEVKSVVQHQA